jgi:hypothetical protein
MVGKRCQFVIGRQPCEKPASWKVTNLGTRDSVLYCDYHGGLADRMGRGILTLDRLGPERRGYVVPNG